MICSGKDSSASTLSFVLYERSAMEDELFLFLIAFPGQICPSSCAQDEVFPIETRAYSAFRVVSPRPGLGAIYCTVSR